MGIIDAIPGKWRRTLHDNHSFTEIYKNEDTHIIINNQFKNIKMIQSKNIYIELLQKKQVIPSCIASWNNRLGINFTLEEWKYIFNLPKTIITDTKVLEIQIKILHRCYVTNSIISKWDDTKTPECVICKKKANILHNFVSCTVIYKFWQEISYTLISHNIYDSELTSIDIYLLNLNI